jgi:hypothetical protein
LSGALTPSNLLEDGTILHLEFQSRNDKDMPYRQGIYCLLLGQKYRRRVRQAVIYFGQAKLHMVTELDLGQTRVSYTLLDIRDIDADMFLASGRPADLPLAMLARGGPERLADSLRQAVKLAAAERDNVLSELAQLCGLRQLQQPLIMEIKTMLSPTDIFRQIPQVQDMVRKGQTKILRGQIKAKFHTLPKWADERLESASSVQVQRWSKKILTADTLEGVLGKR